MVGDELDMLVVVGDMAADMVGMMGLYEVGMLQGVGTDKAVGNVQGIEQVDMAVDRVVGMAVDEDKRELVRHGKRVQGLLLDSNTIIKFKISRL